MEKKYHVSPVVIFLYVVAFITLAYALWSTVFQFRYLVNYYQEYGQKMSSQLGTVLQYMFKNAIVYYVFTAMMLGIASVLNQLQKLDPSNYKSEKDLAAEKAWKEAGKEALLSDAAAEEEDEEPAEETPAEAEAEEAAEAETEPAAETEE